MPPAHSIAAPVDARLPLPQLFAFGLQHVLVMAAVPIVVPGLYSRFPATAQLVLGNGLAMGAVTAIVLNIVFHHLGASAADTPTPTSESLPPEPASAAR